MEGGHLEGCSPEESRTRAAQIREQAAQQDGKMQGLSTGMRCGCGGVNG
jgi:hypothetical protein